MFPQLYRDGKRVLECLQRALRVADACMDTAVSVELFVEILNRYVYYFDQQNETVSRLLSPLCFPLSPFPLKLPLFPPFPPSPAPLGPVIAYKKMAMLTQPSQVTTKYLNGLIELIHSNLQTNADSSSLENPKRHFQRTLDYIKSREYEGVVTAAK